MRKCQTLTSSNFDGIGSSVWLWAVIFITAALSSSWCPEVIYWVVGCAWEGFYGIGATPLGWFAFPHKVMFLNSYWIWIYVFPFVSIKTLWFTINEIPVQSKKNKNKYAGLWPGNALFRIGKKTITTTAKIHVRAVARMM